jgi:DNA-binding IclR family transcriptional regulator
VPVRSTSLAEDEVAYPTYPLIKELDLVRSERVAFDREEHTLGICAVGAAFRDPMGRLAAVSIPVPTVQFRGNEQRLASILPKYTDAIQRDWASPHRVLHLSKHGAARRDD